MQDDPFEPFNYNGPQDIFPCSQMPQSEVNERLQTEEDCLYDDEFFKGIEMIEQEAEKVGATNACAKLITFILIRACHSIASKNKIRKVVA